MIVDCSHCQHSSRCPIELALDPDQSVPESTPALQVMTKCNISPFSKTYACAWYIGGFSFHTRFEISAIPIALCNLCTTLIHAVNVKPILKASIYLGLISIIHFRSSSMTHMPILAKIHCVKRCLELHTVSYRLHDLFI